MFAAHCTTTDSEVLLFAQSILAMHNTSDGIQVLLRCDCGETLSVLTGRQRRTEALVRA